MRQAVFAGDLDMVENDIGAEGIARAVGVVEGIDHADPVIENVREADRHQIAGLAIGIFDHAGADRGFLDHGGEFERVHVRHAAIGVAVFEIAAKQSVLFLGRPG